MTRLHCVADLHLRDDPAQNRGVVAALRAAVDRMGTGDKLAILGDLTDGGTAAQYRQALAILGPLTGRLVLVPGNHDVGTLGLLVHATSRRRWAQLVAALRSPLTLQLGDRLVGVLDTNRYSVLPTDLARGRLGARQTARARDLAEQARRQLRRPTWLLHCWPWTTDPTLALDDADAVQKLVAVEQADVVAGHTHQGNTRTGPGWHAWCVASLREDPAAVLRLDC